ncbi:hypothetical protein [uncultured Eubacterium sp.]|uniref:hypothetical protein n=1 Tax=uncultured Eubacterium sp. TaxID=165185 RepID=UPI0026733926|nr:hypothetical protein [uncultured Eubacterium sp.]
MRTEITREFKGAEEKELKVFYNETLGDYEVETNNEVISFHDEMNEAGDESNGAAVEEVERFIKEF